MTAIPKGSKGSLERGERASLIIQEGTASAISRSRFNEMQDRSWTRSCVGGLDGTTLCVGCKQLKGTGRTPYRSIRSKDYTGEVVAFREVCMERSHS